MNYFKAFIISFLLLFIVFTSITYYQANNLITNPKQKRDSIDITPQSKGLHVNEVMLINKDKQKLYGYFAKSKNKAYILLQHGYKDNPKSLFDEAKVLQDYGYGILISSVRSNGKNDGKNITFGKKELDDLDLWYKYLLKQGASPDKIGLYGNSLGAYYVLKYASLHPKNISAIISAGGFSSLKNTINISIKYFTGLPPKIFAPAIIWWIENWLTDLNINEIDTTKAVAELCSMPILIIQGGKDKTISPNSGKLIYNSACGKKDYWYSPNSGHINYLQADRQEFIKKVINFYKKHLLK